MFCRPLIIIIYYNLYETQCAILNSKQTNSLNNIVLTLKRRCYDHFLLTGLDEKRVARVKEPKLNLTTHALINHLTIPD